jgi:hypothetical protein
VSAKCLNIVCAMVNLLNDRLLPHRCHELSLGRFAFLSVIKLFQLYARCCRAVIYLEDNLTGRNMSHILCNVVSRQDYILSWIGSSFTCCIDSRVRATGDCSITWSLRKLYFDNIEQVRYVFVFQIEIFSAKPYKTSVPCVRFL